MRDWFHFGGTKLFFPVLCSVYFVTGTYKHSLNIDLRDHHNSVFIVMLNQYGIFNLVKSLTLLSTHYVIK